VINFDAPEDRDVYVHRTGRTGRAGASGVAASFVLPDQRREMRKIAADLGLHHEFDSGKGIEHAARQHSGNGAGGGKSFVSGNGGHAGGSGRNVRPGRSRRRRRRSGSARG
jgi:superfamily II DNA/RNA helicase